MVYKMEHILLHAFASFILYPGWALSSAGTSLGNERTLSTKSQLPLPCQEYNDGLIYAGPNIFL